MIRQYRRRYFLYYAMPLITLLLLRVMMMRWYAVTASHAMVVDVI